MSAVDPGRRAALEHRVLARQLADLVGELVAQPAGSASFARQRSLVTGFLRHRLLPYLMAEERRWVTKLGERRPDAASRLVRDHDRLRAGAAALERSPDAVRTLVLARDLMTMLDRHSGTVLPR